MDVIERMYLIWRCECGAQAPWSGHRTICAGCGSRTRTEVEVVPIEQLRTVREVLHEVRLLGEQWKRSGDSATRIMGADLVQILDGDTA